MSVKVIVDIDPRRIIQSHGLDKGGRFHAFATNTVMLHMERYMPFLTGETIHLMQIQTVPKTGQIILREPQARYLYHGKRMVNEKTGKGPAHIPNVGYRYKKGTKLKPTGHPINYTKTKNQKAGAEWDKRMWSEEREKIIGELEDFLNK